MSTLNLNIKRIIRGPGVAAGTLSINGAHFCFTLEDEERDAKVHGETAIPRGTYAIQLRWFPTLSKKFGHEMMEVVGVKGFSGVAIHSGQHKDDTLGCPLVGWQLRWPVRSSNPRITERIKAFFGFASDDRMVLSASTACYLELYDIVTAHIEAGGDVKLTIE